MNPHDIIIRPVLSEKAFGKINAKCYTFEVAMSATKLNIREAVEAVFKGVKVEKVNTTRVKGKPKRQGKHEGMTSEWKKAIVQLTNESKSIEFFDGLQ